MCSNFTFEQLFWVQPSMGLFKIFQKADNNPHGIKMVNNKEIEVKENISKGKTVRTHCNKCRQLMNHQILMNYYEQGSFILDSDFDTVDGEVEYPVDYSTDFQIVKCLGCDTVSYRSYKYFSEYVEPEFGNDGTWEERFPAPQDRTKKDFKNLVHSLRNIYQEVITIYNNTGFILCAAGIRAILEGICKDKGISDGNLEKKINAMYEQGLVSKQQESILHDLRFLGNGVLHELQTPSSEEIDAALDIIEHILEDLYEIPGKSDILKQKKKHENKSSRHR
jgi:hypothetical protein